MHDFLRQMNTLRPYPEDITILIIKFLQGRCDEQETRSLYEWLNTDADHKRIFDEISDLWSATLTGNPQAFDAFSALKKVKDKTIRSGNKVRKTNNKSIELSIPYRLLKVAAIFIFALIIGSLAFYFVTSYNEVPSADGLNLTTEIAAPIGSKSHVVLPDGTKIWLNAGSSLKYSSSFNKGQREVSLVGEAFFDVAKKKGAPFFVKTNEVTIKVLGTAFNVKAYPNEGSVSTTLVRGSLVIEHRTKGKAVLQTVLEPNQQATYIKNSGQLLLSSAESETLNKEKIHKIDQIKGKILLTKKIDTEPFTAWKDNRLVFRNESFESLAIKLERWYGVKINIKGDEIKNFHFNGTIENETVDDVMKIIKYALPIDYDIKHNVISIRLKPEK